jgi:hypothetical protein
MEQETKLTAEQTAIHNAMEDVRTYINMRSHLLEMTRVYEEHEVFIERGGEIKGLDWVLELLDIIEQDHGIPTK